MVILLTIMVAQMVDILNVIFMEQVVKKNLAFILIIEIDFFLNLWGKQINIRSVFYIEGIAVRGSCSVRVLVDVITLKMCTALQNLKN